NLRDIPTDTVAGKRTLAVLLGDRATRTLYVVLYAGSLLALVALAAMTSAWALLGLAVAVPAARALRLITGGANGPALVPALAATGQAELLYGAGTFLGLLLA